MGSKTSYPIRIGIFTRDLFQKASLVGKSYLFLCDAKLISGRIDNFPNSMFKNAPN